MAEFASALALLVATSGVIAGCVRLGTKYLNDQLDERAPSDQPLVLPVQSAETLGSK